MFNVDEEVRIVGEPLGSPNEFARVDMIGGEGRHGLYWVANINMPYYGTICGWMREDQLAKRV